MPPADEPQPPEHLRQAAAGMAPIASSRASTASRRAIPGRVTARRLNRAEYNNTVRDLLGVELRPADDFPQDDSGYGFDNIGDVLSLSPALMEKYLTAGGPRRARGRVRAAGDDADAHPAPLGGAAQRRRAHVPRNLRSHRAQPAERVPRGASHSGRRGLRHPRVASAACGRPTPSRSRSRCGWTTSRPPPSCTIPNRPRPSTTIARISAAKRRSSA